MSTRKLATIALPFVALAGFATFAVVGGGSGDGGAPSDAPQLALPPGPEFGQVVLAASATPSPPPEPIPSLDSCGPPLDRAYLAANQVLSYYGNPYTTQMGILGKLQPPQLAARLRAHAATYDALNGPVGVRPAFHIVYGRATADRGREGNHLLYVDDDTMNQYLDLACREGFLVFVDVQIGLSDVATEVGKLLPWLEYPHVHIAIDPEFAMAPGELPGQTVGTVDAEDVNAAQDLVQAYVRERGLGEKMLIVHQFLHEMLTRPELLKSYPNVRLVIDMDGFGPSDIKRVKYGWFSGEAEYAGIKLFFKQDPDLMSEADILALQPDVIIYQ